MPAILDEYDAYVTDLLTLTTDLTNSKGSAWTVVGAPTFSDDGVILKNSDYIYKDILLGDMPFTIDFDVTRLSSVVVGKSAPILQWGVGNNGVDGFAAFYKGTIWQNDLGLIASSAGVFTDADLMIFAQGADGPQYDVRRIPLNQKAHVALVYTGQDCVLYVNDVGIASHQFSNLGGTARLSIGWGSGSYYVDADKLFSNFRITKGVARYVPKSSDVPKNQHLNYRSARNNSQPAQVTPINPQRTRTQPNTYRYLTSYQSSATALPPTQTGRISGVVTIQGTVAARKVRLYNRSTGLLVGQVMSGIDGSYTFKNIDPSFEYFAVGHDYTRAYNAVIQDFIQP